MSQEQSRPAIEAGELPSGGSRLNQGTDTTAMDGPSWEVRQRRAWADRMRRLAPAPRPRYGSREWLELPDGHPAKVAAVVVAAECWASAGDDLARDLAAELEQARWSAKRAEDAQYRADIEAHAAFARRLLGATAPPAWKDQPPPRPLEDIGRDYMRDMLRGGAA